MQHDETQPGCITIIILAAKIDKRNEACCRRGDISCTITTGHFHFGASDLIGF